MKIVFSTKNVKRPSFLDSCRYAYDYGFDGFEIFDAIKERNRHYDSILRRDRTTDAKRKLVNRNLAVSALRMPAPLESDEINAEAVLNYALHGRHPCTPACNMGPRSVRQRTRRIQ